ncbi:MAG: EAL domain-containing protein [Chloroflexi bacterium]|nr:EAL domain-containing protein [Chloroflexota bacterium]
MSWQFTPYLLPLVSSALLPICLALFVLRRPNAAGARAFVALMGAVAAWSIAYSIELAAADAHIEIIWHRWTYVVGDLVPPAWIIFAAHYAGGRAHGFVTSRRIWLAVVPLISLLFVLSGDPSGLIWSSFTQDTGGPFLAVRGEPGTWFWIDLAYSYVVIVSGIVMLARSLFRSRRLYHQQILMLLMGVVLPWLADLATNLGFGPLPDLDMTPMACTATAIVFAWGLFRFHFFDVVPVARDVVFEELSDAVLVLDGLNRIVDLNAAATRILGVEVAAVSGRPAPDVLHGWPEMIHASDAKQEVRTELTLDERSFDVHVSPLRKAPRGFSARLVVLRDITERKSLEQRLAQQAYGDALTGLANRAHFQARLAEALSAGQRTGVLFLDLDDFKTVNDSLGHPAGDRLLVEVAGRLQASLDHSATAARLGGDEFAVLVPGADSMNALVAMARQVLGALERPFDLSGRELPIRASIGIAASSPDVRSPDDLLRNADLALYAAKAKGKSRYAVFDASMERNALERLELEASMRQGLERGEFEVYYQPIVSLLDSRIIEVEALVRWNHPIRGLVAPSNFIPLAEETGIIVPLGQFVLETACRDVRSWQTRFAGCAELGVSVNLSGRQFQHPSLFEDIDRALQDSGLPPDSLCLEITESVAMEHPEATAAALELLKLWGTRVAIDDFGTGYSSLSYLKRFPVDALKIDQSFVEGLGGSGHDSAIVRAIVALARSLGMQVTAEGIESEVQRQYLAGTGADRGQGYLFSRPVPRDQLAAMLESVAQARAA